MYHNPNTIAKMADFSSFSKLGKFDFTLKKQKTKQGETKFAGSTSINYVCQYFCAKY